MLTGCSDHERNLNRVMELRDTILNSQQCNFTADITADYGKTTYTFKMDCQTDSTGDMDFKVTYPDSIEGITGQVVNDKAGITFDEHILAFESLADGQITPVTAPWLMMKALRSGYIRSCTDDEQCLVIIDDSYETNAIAIRILMDVSFKPKAAEIIWNDQRIMLLEISNFSYM